MLKLDTYLQENRDKFEEELSDFLRIPSISADSRFGQEMGRASEWVANQFKNMGLQTEVIETEGHPLVYAESPAVEGSPTVLVYGHYDVQPPDPLEEWISPPFEPVKRDGNIYARGATDDKGQMLTHIKSAQAWMETEGHLPVQVKYLIEGEEEMGSKSLYRYLAESPERLACDVLVISDTSQLGPGQPAITYGLKGIVYYELQLQGPKQDLHSGSFGGAVTNPVNTLARLLASLVDGKGRIQVPDFYVDVDSLEIKERNQLAALPFDETVFMQQIGVDGLSGEVGYTTLERRWARPTYDINGIWGGYQGEGEKTILPAKGGAKFSFRLVPNQDPDKITESLREFLLAQIPPGIKLDLKPTQGAPGVVVSLDSPYMTAAARAIEQGFGQSPVFIREGGSIPIVTTFFKSLGVDVLLLGWGLDDDNMHSPNEKFSLADFHRGTKASAYLWQELSEIDLKDK